jgi:3-deoxy-D-manno-octulosonic-acid transferase
MLASFDLILAQDAASEQRLSRLGGEVAGRLNLKLLGAPLPFDPADLAALKAALAGRQVVLAASTHAAEEAPIVAAVASLSPRPLTIVAPRHPERTAEIVRDLAGHRVAVRSAGDALGPETDVYLADTLGELGLFLSASDVAVMAGSFRRDIGGHNPLEAARLGVGVITGPDIANHADAFLELAEAGGAVIVPDQAALAAALAGLLRNPARLAGFNRAALAYASRQGDQLATGLNLIRPLLPAP